jgi:hypothetical protein
MVCLRTQLNPDFRRSSMNKQILVVNGKINFADPYNEPGGNQVLCWP